MLRLIFAEITPVPGAEISQKVHPVQVPFRLAGIHIIPEGLVHGLRGHMELHPFNVLFFLFLPIVLAGGACVLQGIDITCKPGSLAHHGLA